MSARRPRNAHAVNQKWFADCLKDADRSQRELARHLGISPSQVSKILGGERRVQLQEVEALAIFLGKTNAEVLTNLGVNLSAGGSGGPQASTKIPVVGALNADGTTEIDLDKPERMIDAPSNMPPGTVAISATNASHSTATLLIGGVFYVALTDRLDPAAIGRLSLVRLSRGPWMLRTVQPAAEVGLYNLISQNGVLKSQTVMAGAPILLIRP